MSYVIKMSFICIRKVREIICWCLTWWGQNKTAPCKGRRAPRLLSEVPSSSGCLGTEGENPEQLGLTSAALPGKSPSPLGPGERIVSHRHGSKIEGCGSPQFSDPRLEDFPPSDFSPCFSFSPQRTRAFLLGNKDKSSLC